MTFERLLIFTKSLLVKRDTARTNLYNADPRLKDGFRRELFRLDRLYAMAYNRLLKMACDDLSTLRRVWSIRS